MFKNFSVQTKHFCGDRVHIDYVFIYAFQYQGVGGRVSLLSFVEKTTFAFPVALPTRGLFPTFFAYPYAVSAAGSNSDLSPLRVEKVSG